MLYSYSQFTELYGEIAFSQSGFTITCALHPSTYLNKLLLGSCQGQLQLWNIRTSTLIYTIKGWGSKITSLAQSQAVDIVGIGLENGNVMVHNLKYDETVMNFQQDWGPVTAISFRTGKGCQSGIPIRNFDPLLTASLERTVHKVPNYHFP